MGVEQVTRRRALVAGVVVGKESLIQYTDTVLTNAQVLALRATPRTLVAAPGAGRYLDFLGAIIVANTTAGAYTETADNLAIRQTGASGIIVSDTIEATGVVDAAAVKMTSARPKVDAIGTVLNAALVLHNTGDGEYGGGNAANTIRIRTFYTVQSLTGFGTPA
jgi:hypothetical protein